MFAGLETENVAVKKDSGDGDFPRWTFVMSTLPVMPAY